MKTVGLIVKETKKPLLEGTEPSRGAVVKPQKKKPSKGGEAANGSQV